MWNNNNCLWIILIILLIGCWGNGTCGSSCGCAGGSGCSCGNPCDCCC